MDNSLWLKTTKWYYFLIIYGKYNSNLKLMFENMYCTLEIILTSVKQDWTRSDQWAYTSYYVVKCSLFSLSRFSWRSLFPMSSMFSLHFCMQGGRLLSHLQVSLIALFITLLNVNSWFEISDVDVSPGKTCLWVCTLFPFQPKCCSISFQKWDLNKN